MKQKEFATEIVGNISKEDINAIAKIFAKDFLDKKAKAENPQKGAVK